MKAKKKTLKNGVRLILVPIRNSPTTTAMVMVETGSDYEAKSINGISHFLEHMCFKGTKKRPQSSTINHELDALGSASNAFTSNEFTGYFAKAHPKHLKKIIDIISDIYLNSTFPEQEIRKERGVIIEEINMYEDLPRAKVELIFNKLLYGDQPAGKATIGSKDIINKISREDFLTYHKKHYIAPSTVIMIAGSFNEKRITDLLEKTFSNIPTGRKPIKEKTIEKQQKPQSLVTYKKTGQIHLILGVRAWGAKDKRNIALNLLNTVLGRGMSSRLFTKLREEMGVCYYVNSSLDISSDYGSLQVRAGVNSVRLEEVVVATLKEFRKLKTLKVTESELKKAKDFLIGNMYLNLESSDSLGEFYLIQEILEKKLLSPKELEKKIQKVTAKSIESVANDIFKNKNLNLAIVGNVKNAKKLSSILKL